QGRQGRVDGVGTRPARGPNGRRRPERRRGPVRDRIRVRDLQRLRRIPGDEKERKDTEESNDAEHEDLLTGRSLFRPVYTSVQFSRRLRAHRKGRKPSNRMTRTMKTPLRKSGYSSHLG